MRAVINGKTLTEPKERVDAYLRADVIRSHTSLGHEIDMDTPEGFGLMLFGLVMLDRGLPCNTNTWICTG